MMPKYIKCGAVLYMLHVADYNYGHSETTYDLYATFGQRAKRKPVRGKSALLLRLYIQRHRTSVKMAKSRDKFSCALSS